MTESTRPKLSAEWLGQLRRASRAYFEALDQSDLAPRSKSDYTVQVGYFIRWLEGTYEPGQGAKNRSDR